tara:strand:- start:405 stop:716 length:312 start_codon:yes stop_codon:yes gene_type:complete
MFDIKILPKIIILLTMIFGTGFIGNIGIPGLVIILLIILVLFGAGKLPRIAGDLAKGIKNFKSGMKEETSKEDDKEIKKEDEVDVDKVAAKKEKTEKDPIKKK